MSDAVIVAAIGAGATVVVGVLIEVIKKVLGRAKEKADKEQNLSTGLRLDLARKEAENVILKKENDDLESEKDSWRQNYWSLYEKYMSLRVLARTILLKNGWTQADVDDILPEKNPLDIQQKAEDEGK